MDEFIRTASKRELDKMASRANEMVASAPSTFALKQMKKMGWSEGTGLGKNRDGTVAHVRAEQRDDSVGLGYKEKDYERWGEQWWYEKYNTTAAKIGGDAAMTLSSDSDSDSDDSSGSESSEEGTERGRPTDTPRTTASRSSHVPSDAELLKACKGRRCGMRARATQKGKWKRAELLTPRSAADATSIVADSLALDTSTNVSALQSVVPGHESQAPAPRARNAEGARRGETDERKGAKGDKKERKQKGDEEAKEAQEPRDKKNKKTKRKEKEEKKAGKEEEGKKGKREGKKEKKAKRREQNGEALEGGVANSKAAESDEDVEAAAKRRRKARKAAAKHE